MTNPRTSRTRLLEFIISRQEGASLNEIRDLIMKEQLWFGPSTDYVDFLYSIEANGEIEIDLEEGRVRPLNMQYQAA